MKTGAQAALPRRAAGARCDLPAPDLTGSKDLIGRRLATRHDHYMPTVLLDSQVEALEPPEPDENAIIIDAGRKPAAEAAEIVRRLDLAPSPGSSSFGARDPGQSSVGRAQP